MPDHSTFSKNKHGRFRENTLFRHVFETVLSRCMKAGLVGGEGFAIDASLIKADANRQRGIPGTDAMDWTNPQVATRPVREYLAALEATEPSGKAPKNISLTDPASRWTSAAGGPVFYAYSANYLIDLDVGIIVDSETTTARRTEEVGTTQVMIERTEERFGIRPDRLAADTAYGSAPTLAWLVEEKEIEPHIPVWDKYTCVTPKRPSHPPITAKQAAKAGTQARPMHSPNTSWALNSRLRTVFQRNRSEGDTQPNRVEARFLCPCGYAGIPKNRKRH